MENSIIKVPRGNAGKLAKIFECTNVMVSLSLTGKKNTELAKKIRHVALTQYGGEEFIAKSKQEFNY